MLRQWLRKSNISINKAAKQLQVSAPVLCRQLNTKDTLPLSRINEMIRLWSPSEEETEKMKDLIVRGKETWAHELKPGDIVYYGHWGSVCKGIFCGFNFDGSQCIVFQIFPKPIVLHSAESDGRSEFYACTEEHEEHLFPTPEALMEHETAEIRANMESQLESMTEKQ